jgi:hypothetical protein
MPNVRLSVNFGVCFLLNIYMYFLLQAKHFKNITDVDNLRAKIWLVAICDIITLISFVADFYPGIGSQLCYIILFFKIRQIVLFISKNSSFTQILEIFLKQSSIHLSSLSFIILIIFTFIMILMAVVPAEHYWQALSLGETTNYVLVWLYDNNWLATILSFGEVRLATANWIKVCVLIFIFIGHYSIRNSLLRFFISVVMECYKKYREFSDCIFNQDIINEFCQRWRQ